MRVIVSAGFFTSIIAVPVAVSYLASCNSSPLGQPDGGDMSVSDMNSAALDLASVDLAPTENCQPNFSFKAGTFTFNGKLGYALYLTPQPAQNTSVVARFYQIAGSSRTCVQTVAANCLVSICSKNDQFGTFSDFSAGDLTLTGGNGGFQLMYQPDGGYVDDVSIAPLWSGGETLHFSASGADVPAFTATVEGPSSVTLTAPTNPGAGLLAVDRASDLPISWTPGAVGIVSAEIFTDTVNNVNSYLRCEFAASLGQGTVPASALKQMPQGAATFQVFNNCAQHASPGGFDTAVELQSAAASATISYSNGHNIDLN